MNWKRILMGKVSIHYYKFQKWNTFQIDRYWSGRLIYLGFSKISFQLDCRVNWVEDMITGNPG
jgi:hypothetical protein